MKAARFHGRRDIRIDEVPEPNGSLGEHEVLLEVAASGICGTDLHEYAEGPLLTSRTPHPLTGASVPQILGHELSGTVLAVGDAVSRAQPGDRVTVMPGIFCGECHYCLRGLQAHCVRMGSTGMNDRWGGFAPRAVVADYQVTPLPANVSLDEGALMEPAAVAFWAVARAGIVPGSDVLVTGAGPIGALVVLAGLAAGAAHIYVVDPNRRRREATLALGATEVFDPHDTDVSDELMRCSGGLGVDVSVECSGTEAGLATCVAATRARGTIAQTGIHMRPVAVDVARLNSHALTLMGTWCWLAFDFERVVALVASGRFPIGNVISRRIALDGVVDQGFESLLSPQTDDLKVLVVPADVTGT